MQEYLTKLKKKDKKKRRRRKKKKKREIGRRRVRNLHSSNPTQCPFHLFFL
jgi:CelD/BcsL family acetyltransferase involved in cellulose biosynthesis